MHLSTAAVRKCHPAVYGVVFFALLIPLYHLSWQYHKGHPWRLPSRRPTRQHSKDFVGDWLNTHLVEPFNPSAVRSYCNATDWRPNLVFRFDRANGTIGDVRGNIVDFLFYALEAGASVVLPEIANVDKTDSGGALDGPTPFDHSFDEEWFINVTSQACPQMTIYRSPDIETLPSALPAKYTPKSRRIDLLPENSPKAYRDHLLSWLHQQPTYTPDEVTVITVTIPSTLWEIDTRSLPPPFRRNFPQFVRTAPSLRHLTALALQTLKAKFPTLTLDPRDPIPHKAFFGVFLEISPDPPKDGKPHAANANFSQQTDAYIAHALELDMPVPLIYASSRNASDLALFVEKAERHNPPLSVTTQKDLIPSFAAQEFEALSSDQKVLVDYEILSRCGVFAGHVNSSFVWDVVLKRAQVGEDQARAGDPWRVRHVRGGAVWGDGVSWVVGRDEWREERVGRGVWP